jgi:hypothetical protein
MTDDHENESSQEERPSAGESAEEPPWDGSKIDTAFAAIVARFSEDGADVGPWSASEDVPSERSEKPQDAFSGPRSRAVDQPTVDFTSHTAKDDLPETTTEGEFVPPDPDFPRGDLITRLAWLGVIGGPLALIIMTLTGWRATTFLLTMSLGSFVAGLIALVSRLPTTRPDDPDDGAVV